MSDTKKSILILGASGRTGRMVLAEALKRGFLVVALVRKQSSLEPHANLTIVEGTPLELGDVQKAFKAARTPVSALVSTLGQTRKSGNPWAQPTSPPLFMADATRNAITTIQQTGLPVKLVIMSLLGVGDSQKNNNFLLRWVFNNSAMSQTIEDGDAVDKLVKASGLEFVLVRSSALMGEKVTPVQDLGDQGELAGCMPSISPAMVADFLLDAVESDQWNGRTPVISA